MTGHLLLTGATGKVGRHFLDCFLQQPQFREWQVRALCHHRTLPPLDRVEAIQGSLSDLSLIHI